MQPAAVTPDFLETQTRLEALLRYFAIPVIDKSHGRHTPNFLGIIFYPDFVAACRRSTAVLDRVWPKASRERMMHSAGISPAKRDAHAAWFARVLRLVFDRLLGALRFPQDSLVHADHISYAYLQDGVRPDDLPECEPGRRIQLFDPQNYTVFRRIRPAPVNVQRVLLAPPSATTFGFQAPGLPAEFTCLYHAWATLAQRGVRPHKPEEAGLEWTNTGHIFVNWKRFLSSRFAPYLPFDGADRIAFINTLPEFLKGGRFKGEYRFAASAFPEPKEYADLAMTTHVVNITPWGEFEDSCSVFDPLYLHQNLHFFDAAFHSARVKRIRRSQARSVYRRKERYEMSHITGEDPAPERLSKLHAFPYRPSDHVPPKYKEAGTEHFLTFPANREEVAYGIIYRNNLYFRPPHNFPITQASPEAEVTAWKSAMSVFKVMERFAATGEIGDVAFRPFKELIKEIAHVELEVTQKQLEQTDDTQLRSGFHSLRHVPIDQMSCSARKRLRKATVLRYGQDVDSRVVGERWYHDTVLVKARRTLPLAAVCRVANVLFDGTTAPVSARFFSYAALKQVLKFSLDAPYLHAWASYCIKAYNTGLALADIPRAQRAHWVPQDDYTLLKHYRRYPPMTPIEKDQLCALIPHASWMIMISRVSRLNAMLKPIFRASQLKKYTIGRFCIEGGPAAHDRLCKRLVLVLGLLYNWKRRNIKVAAGDFLVSRALTLSPGALDNIPLPNAYGGDTFERVLKAAV
jgi:hypothetical protein